jgi:hypothetical protein
MRPEPAESALASCSGAATHDAARHPAQGIQLGEAITGDGAGITGGKPANFPSTISSGLAIVLALMISLLGQTL